MHASSGEMMTFVGGTVEVDPNVVLADQFAILFAIKCLRASSSTTVDMYVSEGGCIRLIAFVLAYMA